MGAATRSRVSRRRRWMPIPPALWRCMKRNVNSRKRGRARMDAQAAQQLLAGLAEEALSGRTGAVVGLEVPQWPPLPSSLRRELDGRSVYPRPGVARYATAAQLSMEDKLIAQAQAHAAPRLP